MRLRNLVRIYKEGVRFYREVNRMNGVVVSPSKPHRRGKINGFSSHTRTRLRDALLRFDLACHRKFGVTLTLPWKDFDKSNLTPVFERYREVFHRFGVSFCRAFPNSACIFRHELQRRRCPHCHMIVYLSAADECKNFKSECLRLWIRALQGDLMGGDCSSFFRYGVKVDCLADSIAMFRYICDHASKSKQAQLGYRGKQWGFLNRRLFKVSDSIEYTFDSPSAQIFFARHIHKCGRFWIRDNEKSSKGHDSRLKFGRHFSKSRSNVSIRFVSKSTCERILDYLKKNKFPVDMSNGI